MAREVSAGLWSNAQSTPIVVSQDRGFRELYVKATVSAHAGAHELKAGADFSGGPVRERLDYRITDRTRFDDGTPEAFSFAEKRISREESLFVQDQIRAGAWTVNAGLRWDRYRLALGDSAISPRLAAAWNWAAADLVLRAAYDRAFQTPSIENLLIASSDSLERAGGDVLRLPVPASRGHFFEAGLSKSLARQLRIDASLFTRRMTDVADDDLLLNTGVSFPIAFHRAEINGAEIKIELPRWKNVSGSLGYSHLHGVGQLPITGGLFLGEEAASQLASTERFPVTQDQRHTIRARAAYQWSSRGWMAVAGSFGSGLPFEDFDDTPEEAVAQFGPRVVERVSFETGRVRPSASLDVSAGDTLSRSTRRGVRVQAEIRNLTNRLDVINFAGLFSGTALAPPRSAAVRLRFDFH
jgi:outer membrane receptor protein involved in Fe transport